MFVGKAGSGKDTAAQLVKNLVPGTAPIALADPLKEFARTVFGFSHEQMYGPSSRRGEPSSWSGETIDHTFEWAKGSFARETGMPIQCLVRWMSNILTTDRTGRYILQTLGTEVGRDWNQNVWIDTALKTAGRVLSEENVNLVTITDGRFKNEVLRVKEIGGIVINIRDPDRVSTSSHVSEKEQDSIPDFWYDAVINNDKSVGLLPLQMKLRIVLGKHLTPDVFWTTKLSPTAMDEL
jgi:hypothetical protein